MPGGAGDGDGLALIRRMDRIIAPALTAFAALRTGLSFDGSIAVPLANAISNVILGWFGLAPLPGFCCSLGNAQLHTVAGAAQPGCSVTTFGWATIETPVGIGGYPVRFIHCGPPEAGPPVPGFLESLFCRRLTTTTTGMMMARRMSSKRQQQQPQHHTRLFFFLLEFSCFVPCLLRFQNCSRSIRAKTLRGFFWSFFMPPSETGELEWLLKSRLFLEALYCAKCGGGGKWSGAGLALTPLDVYVVN